MGKILNANNCTMTLSHYIDDTMTEWEVTKGPGNPFPLISSGSGDTFYVTLYSRHERDPWATHVEIIKVTGNYWLTDMTGQVLTVVRGIDGTFAHPWRGGTLADMRNIAAQFNGLLTLDSNGNLDIPGDLNVGGNETIGGNLEVKGTSQFDGTATFESDVIIQGYLEVDKGILDKGDLIVNGNEEVDGNLLVKGDGTFNGDLTVYGDEYLSGNLYVGGSSLKDIINSLIPPPPPPITAGGLLSSDPGNLLTLGSDGKLYYSSVITTQYYVDASVGSDSNDGSRANPFATLAHAVNTIPEGTTGGIIHLMENQTHIIRGSQGKHQGVQSAASISFITYGPFTDSFISASGPTCAAYGLPWYGLLGAPLATITPIADVHIDGSDPSSPVINGVLAPLSGATFTFLGLQLHSSSPPSSGWFVNRNYIGTYTSHSGNGLTIFSNCQLFLEYSVFVNIAPTCQALFDTCNFTDTSGGLGYWVDADGSTGGSFGILGLPSSPVGSSGYTTIGGLNAQQFQLLTNATFGLQPPGNSYPGVITNYPT